MNAMVRPSHNTLVNPETDSKAAFIGAMTMLGALQGAFVGAIFSEEEWWNGLWKGALAGGAAIGAVGAVSALGDVKLSWCEDTGDRSWSQIGRVALTNGVIGAISSAAAGAAIAQPGERQDMISRTALWGGTIFAISQAAIDATYKLTRRTE